MFSMSIRPNGQGQTFQPVQQRSESYFRGGNALNIVGLLAESRPDFCVHHAEPSVQSPRFRLRPVQACPVMVVQRAPSW